MENKACADTGPILHLYELGKSGILKIFSRVIISEIVNSELQSRNVRLTGNIRIEKADKDNTAMLVKRYGIGLGEASVIALCKSLQIPVMLTDDLDAREVAMNFGLHPVGTVGAILRSCRERIIGYDDAKRLLLDLKTKSSLFITSDLVAYAMHELEEYKKRKK